MSRSLLKKLTNQRLGALLLLTLLTATTAWADVKKLLALTADGQTISEATTWTNCVVSITGNSTVTFSERITISGTVTLNLGEGTTLTAPKGIEVDKGNTLTIEGNGALNATADKFYAAIGRGFHDSTSGTSGTININGGTITATGGRFAAAIGGGYEGVSGTINISGGTIVATGGYCAAGIGGGTFAKCGVVNISGGQVTANGDRASGIGPGFDAGTSGTVTLGWTNESDGILASNYNDVETLRVADGKAFTASTGNIYIGTLDDDQRAEFAGKTLVPAFSVNFAGGIEHGTIVPDKFFVAADAEDKTVTLTITPAANYSLGTVKYNDGSEDHVISPNEGVYSFTMPASNVTVSAKFTPDIATHWQASDSRDGSTAEKAYIITTPAGLNLLASEVNSGNSYKNKYFMLGDDITYTHTTNWNDATSKENNYTAIGNSNKYFDGHFDGNGKTVRGIRIYKSGETSGDDNYLGLFGFIGKAGEIKNVVLADARITGLACVGGIVGASNGSPITNCHVFGDVAIYTFRNVAQALGGIAGATAGNITGCTSAASITTNTGNSGGQNFGGIVGYNCGTVSNCLYLGSTINGNTKVGAIVGQNENNCTVQNCYYTDTYIRGWDYSGNHLDYTVSAVGHNAGTVTNSGLAYSIALGKDVSIAGDQTVYDVSGLTAYGNTALSYNNGTTTTIYTCKGVTVPLSYGSTVPEGYTLVYCVKDADNNVVDVSENGGVYSFTMPNKNVNVSTKITRNTTINVEVGNANYMVVGNDAYVVVTMTPDNFNGIATINVTPDGGLTKTYNVAVVNGEGRYVVQNMESDSYTVQASFAGDDKYTASTSDEINLYVPNITTGLDISLDKETINVGEKATVSITLNRTGFTTAQGGTTLLETPKVLSNNEVVTIKLVPYNEDFTGDGFSTIGLNNGKGSFSLSGLAVGEYKFIVIFAGNDEIKGSTSEILKLTVRKNPTTVGVEVEAPVIAKEKNNNLK